MTVDAVGCQKEVAAKLIGAKADYVLALKGNQPKLQEQVAGYIDGLISEGLEPHVTRCKGHGRVGVRRCWAADQLGWRWRGESGRKG